MNRSSFRIGLGMAIILIAGAGTVLSQVPTSSDPPRPPSLKTVPVPEPANLGEFVKDRLAAIRLGKALFWDMQVGSDGLTACASCHFSSGMADTRSINSLSPGLKRITPTGAPNPDMTFYKNLGPVGKVTAADFPFFPLSNDILSSQGIRNSVFLGVSNGPADLTRPEPDPDGFRVGALNVRRVEPRNAPTVINAVFNHRQFWDGRADNVFNGVNELGDRDPNARVYRADNPATPIPVQVRLEDASLASQAVGPPVNEFEMSARGRTMRDIGKKLARGRGLPGQPEFNLRPLGLQLVHPEDSVLGSLSQSPQKGLRIGSYTDMIRDAFHSRWWQSPKLLRLDAQGAVTVVTQEDDDPTTQEYTLMQHNFALFFGLAVQMYEATLVADDSRYDQFMDGNPAAISPQAVAGVDLFRNQLRGQCINCHEGAEMTGAAVRQVRASPTRIRDGQAADRGFNNTSVLDTIQDLALGAKDPLGNWLSTVKRLVPPPPEPIVVDGAFKVPGLRNVELTAPYFHNGGHLDLAAVIEFYSHGGDSHPGMVTLDRVRIEPMPIFTFTPEEHQALQAFLLSLTDERVRFQRAPFDHPQLFVPNGPGAPRSIAPGDRMAEIPAVGRNGGPPQKKFLEP